VLPVAPLAIPGMALRALAREAPMANWRRDMVISFPTVRLLDWMTPA
jgi:hypothetical protein